MGNLSNALLNYKHDHPDIEWRDMADAIGISLQSMVNYLNEKATPRDSTLTLISKVLEIPKDELIDSKEENEETDSEEDLEYEYEEEESAADQELDPEEAPEDEQRTEIHILIGERQTEKPVTGLKPYRVVAIQRIKELADAISRNPDSESIPEWANEIIEQSELMKRMQKSEVGG